MAFGFGFGLPRVATVPLDAAIAGLFPDAWYDPSDLTTLYQDSAGTTLVTAVEQPVGLMLDKSRGLVLGAELVTNGDFSNGTTGWTAYSAGAGTGTIAASGGALLVSNNGGTYARGVTTLSGLTSGRAYRVTGSCLTSSHGAVVRVATASDAASGYVYNNTSLAVGAISFVFFATAATMYLAVGVESSTTAATASFDNISVRELPGNHAYQSTSTSRPIYSKRINLLTKTEQFDDAAWEKIGGGSATAPAVTPNYASAPDGTQTADRIVFARTGTTVSDYSLIQSARITGTTGVATTDSIWLKTTGGGTQNLLVYDDAPSGSALIWSVTGTWQRFSFSPSNTSASTRRIFFGTRGGSGNYFNGGDLNIDICAWGASLVPADLAALGYQRVNTATDYDTADPFKAADSFDGVDDKLTTATGGGATTAFFFCAAIQAKQAGATQTLWSDTGTNTGYRVRINSSNQLELSAGNGSAYTTIATTATLAVGQRAVVTAWHDGTNLKVQIGSGTVASTAFATATAGTAGFSMGGDNGAATSWFKGWIYESVYKKDAAMSAAQIAMVQRYCATKAGITL